MTTVPPFATADANALLDLARFSGDVLARPLRPYQLEPAKAVLQSVAERRGLSIAVMVARQGGKNELSAQLEAALLWRFAEAGGSIVKAAPTFRPQLITSILRLQLLLAHPVFAGWHREFSYTIALGKGRCLFLSAEPTAHVVGATASLLLEFDEAQDVAPEKHDKDFAPMGATTNCTRVYYGTAWNDTTLLHRTIQTNAEAERLDGLRRNFVYPWWVVAECLPAYGQYVQAERDRLGADHPLFRTQYELQPITGAGGLFSAQQRAQLRGDHPRRHAPDYDEEYVAAVDIAGEDEAAEDAALRAIKPRRDSTVLLIGAVDRDHLVAGYEEPRVRVVNAYWFSGRKHHELYATLLDLLRDVWHVRRVCVDASGIGAGVASFLAGALGEHVCEEMVFTAQNKSALGYDLLAAINGGRLKWWGAAQGASPEDSELWAEVGAATYHMGANQLMRWSVPETAGHDDFLVALALLVRAGADFAAPPAAAVIARRPDFDDGRY